MDEATHIEIPELLALGSAVTGIGARFGAAVAGTDAWEHSAVGAVAGSVSCATQLGVTADNWRSTLTLLATSIQDFGDGLTGSAADFWSADRQAAERVHRSGGGVPR